MKDLEINKPYKTRNGFKVRIYTTKAGGSRTIHGALRVCDGQWNICDWLSDGRYSSYELETELDIVSEWEEELMFVHWDDLPSWANSCVAMNKDGEWYCYNGVPTIGINSWMSSNKSAVIPKHLHPVFNGDWKDSIILKKNI